MSSSRDAGFVHLDPIELAIKTLAEGKAVVVVDDEGRENEGDLIFPASTRVATACERGPPLRWPNGCPVSG